MDLSEVFDNAIITSINRNSNLVERQKVYDIVAQTFRNESPGNVTRNIK